MEPQFSVLIYSKYSPNCKKITTLLADSGINLNLQPLCIDNEQIRKRIKGNKQLDVEVVPCILCLFPNGAVEKYEGSHAFNWIETIISQLKPPPQPFQIQQAPPVQPPTDVEEVSEPQESSFDAENAMKAKMYKQKLDKQIEQGGNPATTRTRVRPQPENREDNFPERTVPIPPEQKMPSRQVKKIPSRMKPIEEQSTSIDDIPFETDRHRLVEQPRRIQQDDGKYLEDAEFFSGEPVDYRREPSNVVKSTTQRNISGMNNITAKAKALEQEYLRTQQETGGQNNRPMDARRP